MFLFLNAYQKDQWPFAYKHQNKTKNGKVISDKWHNEKKFSLHACRIYLTLEKKFQVSTFVEFSKRTAHEAEIQAKKIAAAICTLISKKKRFYKRHKLCKVIFWTNSKIMPYLWSDQTHNS